MVDHRVDPTDPLPRYYQVYTSLVERIQAGEFSSGGPLPAERQLAEDYGVSRITVIKALDILERERLVSRQHGRGTFAIDPLQLVPQRASALKGRSVAFLIDVVHEPYPLSMLAGIAREAAQQRYHLQVVSLYGDSSGEAQHISDAIAQGVDGLIVFPHAGYQNAALYRQLRERQFPIVLIDRYYPGVDTDWVVFDDEAASYTLTSALIQQGHRRVAFVPYCEVAATSVRDRLQGYRRALEEGGLRYREDLVWPDLYSAAVRPQHEAQPDSAVRALLRRRLEHDKPTALVAVNYDAAVRLSVDLAAINADRQQRRAGYETGAALTPEIAGFSHQHPGEQSQHRFTAAVQSGELIGGEAARLLLGRLNGTISGAARCIKVPMEIVICGARPQEQMAVATLS